MDAYQPGQFARLALVALLCSLSGCAALTNPATDGIPVHKLPAELRAAPRSVEQSIPLSCLGQPEPGAYRLAPGDTLGVQIDGILSKDQQPLPVNVGPLVQGREENRFTPSSGYPITVQADGTLLLPFLPPVHVHGLTLTETADVIRQRYVKAERLRADLDRVLVSLIQPRICKVMVFRQEASGFTVGQVGIETSTKRGTGHLVDLPGYENDVLHALVRTGGLPGLDACNQIIIYRGCFRDGAGGALLAQQMGQCGIPVGLPAGAPIVRIPLRLPPGAPLPFRPEDVVLYPGDVVFIEGRDSEVFYTAGLLPSGAHVLPRDIDLDVLRAIAQVRGPLLNGAYGGNNLSGTLLADGIGNPSPGLLVVLRRTPAGGQVPIIVDLQKAIADPRERLTVQPGDLLILQERPGDALARYFSTTFFNFNFLWEGVRGDGVVGLFDFSIFNRNQNGAGIVNFSGR